MADEVSILSECALHRCCSLSGESDVVNSVSVLCAGVET